jgi:hypothetical protein
MVEGGCQSNISVYVVVKVEHRQMVPAHCSDTCSQLHLSSKTRGYVVYINLRKR